MDWDSALNGFISYLTLEKGLSGHSIEAYERDVRRLAVFIARDLGLKSPTIVEPQHVEQFFLVLNDVEISRRSQARMLSAIRSFFQYLMIEDSIDVDPTELIAGPRID